MIYSQDELLNRWNIFTPGPVQRIVNHWGSQALSVKRLDLIQSWASGNKYYKLKFHLLRVIGDGIGSVISKGGMYSNHLASFAEACHYFRLKCICVIRSYGDDARNPSLQYLRKLNAELVFLKPQEYEMFGEKQAIEFNPDAYFIPQGGADESGILGAADIADEIEENEFDYIIIPAGTLTTALGLLKKVSYSNVIIIPAWKGCSPHYMEDLLSQHDVQLLCKWDLWADYHFGGFAKYTSELADFIKNFARTTQIPLDPVYTGKMMFAVADQIGKGYFKKDDRILCIHTGGLQGLQGFVQRDPKTWEDISKAIVSL